MHIQYFLLVIKHLPNKVICKSSFNVQFVMYFCSKYKYSINSLNSKSFSNFEIQRLSKQGLKPRNIGFTCCDQSFWIETLFKEKLWKFQLHPMILIQLRGMICTKIKFGVSFQGKCSKYLHFQNIFSQKLSFEKVKLAKF